MLSGTDQDALEALDLVVPRRAEPAVRVVSAHVGVWRRIADIWRYRQLLTGLVRKELKVKYKSSVLGFAWSMLNPAFTLAIYYFVFQIVLGSGIPNFAIWLMAGLLAWNLFSYATMGATSAVVGNAAIVKKVAFPREILALASVGAALVFFCFQAVVLVLALVGLRYLPDGAYLPLLLPALVTLLVLVAALAVFLAAVNVYLRDVQHLVELVVGTAWFWATPIVYSYQTVAAHFVRYHIGWVYLLNPLTDIVLAFQRAIYGHVYTPVEAAKGSTPGAALRHGGQLLPAAGQWWYLYHLLIVLGVSAVLFIAALAVFGRLEGNFAEEL